jgi:hypothetical protein
MPDIPRDPRQLARDILSGKIKLEDLQRERARQMGAPVPPKPPVRQVPVAPARPVPQVSPRPVRQVSPAPPRPVMRPQALPSVIKRPAPMQRPAPVRQQPPVRPAPQQQKRVVPPTPAPISASYAQPARKDRSAPTGTTDRPAPAAPPPSGLRVRSIVGSRQALRQAVLMAEILGTPVGLRE